MGLRGDWLTDWWMRQGFDEFMNLVIDDAVEVKMATKDTVESRRELGSSSPPPVRGLVRMCGYG